MIIGFDARQKFCKQQQKEWIEKQKAEKEFKKQQEKFEQDLYAKEVFETNRMRFSLLSINFLLI